LTFGQIADRLTRGYRAARRALPQHWADAQPENLHELRKRIVTHRYQMETVRPLWPRFSKMWIAEAQRLRERLGKHQDLLVLAKLTEPHQPLARWRGRLGPAVEQRKAEHVRGAQKLATRLLVEKPKAFRQRLEVMWNSAD
jgi:CHAD domain-containing protein